MKTLRLLLFMRRIRQSRFVDDSWLRSFKNHYFPAYAGATMRFLELLSLMRKFRCQERNQFGYCWCTEHTDTCSKRTMHILFKMAYEVGPIDDVLR